MLILLQHCTYILIYVAQYFPLSILWTNNPSNELYLSTVMFPCAIRQIHPWCKDGTMRLNMEKNLSLPHNTVGWSLCARTKQNLVLMHLHLCTPVIPSAHKWSRVNGLPWYIPLANTATHTGCFYKDQVTFKDSHFEIKGQFLQRHMPSAVTGDKG